MTTEGKMATNQLSKHHYTESFFSSLEKKSRLSAEVMVPLVLELAQVRSVIDVGCGTGEWLSVFQENGVEDVWGVDGAYVNKDKLKIRAESFIPTDLEQPFRMDRKFDLVVSLEVAEHLSERSARTFVNSLTELGPVVLFSAAIPNQGGENHLNEQWPEYWAKLFDDKGYVVIDPLRRKVWKDEKVQVWYAQNTLMFVAQEQLEDYPLLRKEYELGDACALSIVHPKVFQQRIEDAKFHNLLARNARYIARKTLRTFLPQSIYRLLRAAYQHT